MPHRTEPTTPATVGKYSLVLKKKVRLGDVIKFIEFLNHSFLTTKWMESRGMRLGSEIKRHCRQLTVLWGSKGLRYLQIMNFAVAFQVPNWVENVGQKTSFMELCGGAVLFVPWDKFIPLGRVFEAQSG